MTGKEKKSVKHTSEAPSCDWKPGAAKKNSGNRNRIFRHKGKFKWSGVKTEKYKQQAGSWSSIARNVLVGNRGETARFHLRYFEIAPGGKSSFEKHKHEHVVVCIRGKGKVLIGKKFQPIQYLDTVYIAPDTPHQLTNPHREPFGFFCIVNSKRDKPKLLTASK